ncbi:MAG: hypothetical protein A2015_05795 [Spirochaetes bacterium GWF1_31_7]|nr:MAG: hypothetical protein A2Y30_00205 [Spirochaetes bacterium GWE1_32_154]OHD47203.1 MAG: hypothetical protein A2Y29_10790 [Spirochaetes bacterium GWE2_31_10]OHD48936.1 MAG: hypothetical protein A2015_05795 [Spirochaetes bacterium GWF1_31_7]OHD74691.1 MAG: hypothetical protein A2355_03355 [Spirochaetes bacterium RIFOXYB1_FULL_32_8]HBD92589.1 alpha-glycosidase [Spirochaetia bacterium]
MKKILFKATCVIMLFCFTNSIVARKQRVRLKDITASINHIYSDESYLYRSPAYPDLNDRVNIKLRVKKNDIDSVATLCKIGDSEFVIQMKKAQSDVVFDYYTAYLPQITGNSTYFFELQKGEQIFYYSRNGISVKYPSSSYKLKIFPGFKTPQWMKGAVLYQIYIDRFYNGDTKNDVVTNEYMYDNYPVISKKWGEYPDSMRSYENGSDRTREFFGGDIEGVIQKLPHLKALGVDGIYFNPIFVSPSNHKYDAQDYENIDPHVGVIIEDDPTLIDPNKDPGYRSKDFNISSAINKDAKKYITRVTSKKNLEASNEKLRELIKKANDNGIKVLLDGVFNHCGSFNKWLDREHLYPEDGAYESKESKFKNFFKFKEDAWPDNESYEAWWGYKTLPKLHFEASEELVDSILNVAGKWIKDGIAGWRLDVAADLGQTAKYNHKFWELLRKKVKEVNPEAVVFAEVYGDASSWLKGNEWDTIMNYDSFFEPVSFFFTGLEKHSFSYTGKLHNNVTEFDKIMKENMAKMPYQSLEIAMNQLDNHDHSRFITRTNGLIDEGKDDGVRNPAFADKDLNKGIFKEAAVFQMTWIGAPTLYYGNEAGLPGWTDPDDRRTYPWGKEDKELLEFYKKIITLHKSYSSIKDGGTQTLVIDDAKKVYSYGRWNDKDMVIVALNNDSSKQSVSIPAHFMGITGVTSAEIVFRSDRESHSDKKESIKTDEKGNFFVDVEPFGSLVIAKINFNQEWLPVNPSTMTIVATNLDNPDSISGSSEISFQFSESINKLSIIDGIKISNNAQFYYSINGKFMTLIPKKKLAKGDYVITFDTSINSLYGNYPLDKEFSYTFTVVK